MSNETLTVRVPLALRKRGGRKVVIAPSAHAIHPASANPNAAFVRALAKAFWYRRLLEAEGSATIRELAHVQGINESYLSRVLRLTLLPPRVINAALNGDDVEFDSRRLTRPNVAAFSGADW